MRGASRASMTAAREQLTAALADPSGAAAIGEELFEVAHLLDREPGLRRALTDATSPVAARTGLARRLLDGRVSGATLGLVAGMAGAAGRRRGIWPTRPSSSVRSPPRPPPRVRASSTTWKTSSSGSAGSSAGAHLRSALSDPRLPADRKRGLLDALLAGKVTPAALRLIIQTAVYPRGRSLDASLRSTGGWPPPGGSV